MQAGGRIACMNEVSYVVVFPTVFSRRHTRQLIRNVKDVLRIRGQQFKSVRRDGDVVLVHANDPVFASSAIGLLFGIEKIAIARCVRNDFDGIVKEIASTGGNLLLQGERFLVRVEGTTSGFLAGDVEIAATSKIIEERSGTGARPGTEENHDKVLYAYLTRDNAYVCIFMDQGSGGVTYGPREQKTACAVYDEISAVSCLEAIKQGHDVRIMVFYRQESELTGLVRIINRIMPRLVRAEVELEFFNLKIRPGAKNYQVYVRSILEVMLRGQDGRISLALSPLVVSADFTDGMVREVFRAGRIPVLPLAGVDSGMVADARDVGLERAVARLQKTAAITSDHVPAPADREVDQALKAGRRIIVTVGPNNVHDILDSLDH